MENINKEKTYQCNDCFEIKCSLGTQQYVIIYYGQRDEQDIPSGLVSLLNTKDCYSNWNSKIEVSDINNIKISELGLEKIDYRYVGKLLYMVIGEVK